MMGINNEPQLGLLMEMMLLCRCVCFIEQGSSSQLCCVSLCVAQGCLGADGKDVIVTAMEKYLLAKEEGMMLYESVRH